MGNHASLTNEELIVGDETLDTIVKRNLWLETRMSFLEEENRVLRNRVLAYQTQSINSYREVQMKVAD
jgi:hypothetical protein